MPHETRPERDEDRRGELEQQADPDRQPLDRDEVEPLDEREADDPVEDEQRQLVPRHAQPSGRRDEQERGEAQKAPVARSSVSRRLETPPSVRMIFETVPLIAKSVDAAVTIT